VTLVGWLQIAVFFALVVATTKPIGLYLFRVFEGDRPLLPRVERLLFRLLGIDVKRDQSWVSYAGALIAFSVVSLVVTYAILRLQHHLPLNPQGFGPVEPALAFNTAASFVTNTNWQSYAGETTMSHFTQMAALAVQNFASAAAGIGVALAVARGLTRASLGNFWVDLVRGTVYVLLPASLVFAILFVALGVPQTLAGSVEVTTLEGVKQTILLGPVASQEAIKMLGTNGGGFFNANSAHPFENPTALSNLLQMWLIFSIGAGLTYTFGKMARDTKQGWALFAAMSILFFAGVTVAYWAEAQHNPAVAALGANLEGKETRFGVAASALFATVTTDASCGAVIAMHDSFSPLGGLVPLLDMQLGEIIFGGVGAGLYGILVYVILTVFIAGLMVGRTPEYLGKKIEGREMKLAMLYILVFPLIVLAPSAWAAVASYGVSSLANGGPHGLTEILYAFSSAAGNNGSAFAGLNANTPFYNVVLGLVMLCGRFLMIVPILGIAGAMSNKKVVPAGPGTFPTNGATFVVLLVGVIVIVGALTFFPAISLGPLVEHFQALDGKAY
jgi:K+-transporting ATPase ATPase A chain